MSKREKSNQLGNEFIELLFEALVKTDERNITREDCMKELKKEFLHCAETFADGIIELSRIAEIENEFSKENADVDDDEEELGRCPFCGSSAHVHKDEAGMYYVECVYCPAVTGHSFHTKEDAVEFWNSRPRD